MDKTKKMPVYAQVCLYAALPRLVPISKVHKILRAPDLHGYFNGCFFTCIKSEYIFGDLAEYNDNMVD